MDDVKARLRLNSDKTQFIWVGSCQQLANVTVTEILSAAAALQRPIRLGTRQHSYRKEDRAMRPIYGCPEKFSESSLHTQLLFQKFVMDFCSDRY